MTSRVGNLADAYTVFGLEPEAGVRAAKAVFRERVKALHPDVTAPTPETLGELSRIIAAIELIRTHPVETHELVISPAQARRGLTRTLRSGGRSHLVRIPAGIADGACLDVIGEAGIAVTIRIDASLEETAPLWIDGEARADLDGFIHEFSRPSAHARFARWIRKAQSAA